MGRFSSSIFLWYINQSTPNLLCWMFVYGRSYFNRPFYGQHQPTGQRTSISSRMVLSAVSLTDDNTNTKNGPLDAILWDMDGVLADTERDGHRPSFNQIFEEEGLDTDWTVEIYGKLLEVGGGKERMTAHWNKVGWPTKLQSMSEEQRQDKVKEYHQRKTSVFMDFINMGTVPLRPGVVRMMDAAINDGLTLAVCSTSSEHAVRNLVQTLLGPDRANMISIFAGDMVQNKKPAPDVYLLAVETLNLDKARCIIIEDSAIGLGAAKAAGITCIVTKSTYTAGEDFSGADMIVDELGDNDNDSDSNTLVTLDTLRELVVRRQMKV
jgi:HAD superfamily hydrolase (TIGR01509 family)